MSRKLKSLNEYKEDIRSFGEGYELIYMFKPDKDPTRTYFQLRCPVGHEYHIRRIGEFINLGKRCRLCFHSRITHSYDDVAKEFKEIGSKLLTPKEKYKNTHQKISYVCDKCGNQHLGSVKSFRKGSRSCTVGLRVGEKHHLYNHDLTEEERGKRRDYRHSDWSKDVLKRDNYTCRKCSSKGTMHAHHIYPYKYFERLRYDLDNGVTLCVKCHNAYHGLFGREHEYPDYVDWAETWRYFSEDYEVPAKKRKKRKPVGVYDPSFSYCPQRIFECNGELFSSIPFVMGYYVSLEGVVIGKRKRPLIFRDADYGFLAYSNEKYRIRVDRHKVRKALFSLSLYGKESLHTSFKYVNSTNKEVPKSEAHQVQTNNKRKGDVTFG